MNKSFIVLIVIVWVLCTSYFMIARTMHYDYSRAAMFGSWAASALLLVCIVIFVRRNK